MTSTQRVKGFINIAQLIVIVTTLLGVGAIYLLRAPGKDTGINIPPQDKKAEVIVTDANFSQLFSTLKRIDGVDSVYSPRVAGVYSSEEVIGRALQLYNQFIEVRGAVTMAGRQPPQTQQPGDPVWMPSVGPAFVTPSGTIVLNNPGGLSNAMPGSEQFAIRGIFRVSQTNGVPTEYYLAIPPLCENCVMMIIDQSRNASCAVDADCKLIYSSCDCEAVPVNDPRTELPSTVMCGQNNCTNSAQTTKAVCMQNRCATVLQATELNPTPSPTGQARIIRGHSTSGRSINITLVHDKSNSHALNNDFIITNNTHIAVSLGCGPVDGAGEIILSEDFAGIEGLPFLFSMTGVLDNIFVNRSNCSLSAEVFNHSGNGGIIGDLVSEYFTPIKPGDRNIEIRVFGLEDCNAPNAGGYCTSRR